MAIGVDVIKNTGRLIFDLQRGDETTTRTIDIPYPKATDAEGIQDLVNSTKSTYTNEGNRTFIQPSNWRDANLSEEQWTTVGVRYEYVTTVTNEVTPDT